VTYVISNEIGHQSISLFMILGLKISNIGYHLFRILASDLKVNDTHNIISRSSGVNRLPN
jgi:hypothetical protein